MSGLTGSVCGVHWSNFEKDQSCCDSPSNILCRNRPDGFWKDTCLYIAGSYPRVYNNFVTTFCPKTVVLTAFQSRFVFLPTHSALNSNRCSENTNKDWKANDISAWIHIMAQPELKRGDGPTQWVFFKLFQKPKIYPSYFFAPSGTIFVWNNSLIGYFCVPSF